MTPVLIQRTRSRQWVSVPPPSPEQTNTVWLSSPQVDSDAGGFERPALQGGGRNVEVTTKPRHEGQQRLRHLYYHAIMDDDRDQSDLVLFETIDYWYTSTDWSVHYSLYQTGWRFIINLRKRASESGPSVWAEMQHFGTSHWNMHHFTSLGTWRTDEAEALKAEGHHQTEITSHYRACRKAPHLKKVVSSQIYSVCLLSKKKKKVYLYECNMLLLLGCLFN